MHRFINGAILYLGHGKNHICRTDIRNSKSTRSKEKGISRTGSEGSTCRTSNQHTEECKLGRCQVIHGSKKVLQQLREDTATEQEKRIGFSPPLFLFFCCLFTSFWLGFVAFKPALLHDEHIIQSKHYWFDTFAFEQFLTHKYTTSNFIGGAMVIGAIVLFYKLASYFNDQKTDYYWLRMDDPIHTKVYINWSVS